MHLMLFTHGLTSNCRKRHFLCAKRNWVKSLIVELYNVIWWKNIHKITFFQIIRNFLKSVKFEQWMNLKLVIWSEKQEIFFWSHQSIMGCLKLGWCCFINFYYSRPIQQLVTHTNILPKLFVGNCLQTVVFLCVNPERTKQMEQ